MTTSHPNFTGPVERWRNCPSTHCERAQECRSPHECSATGRRQGHSALHWDKEAQALKTFDPNPSTLLYEAPRDLSQPLKVRGVGRVADEPRALLVALTERPSDDDIRALHEYLRGWKAP